MKQENAPEMAFGKRKAVIYAMVALLALRPTFLMTIDIINI